MNNKKLLFGICWLVLLMPIAYSYCEFGEGGFGNGSFGQCDTLVEGVDYTIDSVTGQVTLINGELSNVSVVASYQYTIQGNNSAQPGTEGITTTISLLGLLIAIIALSVIGVLIFKSFQDRV